ncbi:MAG: hypothetical protein ISR76_10710 [Planctomycetes bacterium]|nr:hypothetical protein [Planctomycetota bacterium]MBL7009460.1 hypothetical protein [Planctomycetota bacterium]
MILLPLVLGWLPAPAPPQQVAAPEAAARAAELPQEPGAAASAGAPSGAEQAQAWWSKFSPEEKARYRRRFEELNQLSPEELEEVRRRYDAVARHRRRVWTELAPEERERLGALAPAEREAALDERVHERLRRRHEEIAGQFGPGFRPEGLRGPLHERMDASSRVIERLRSEDLLKELDKLHQEGWIGDKAAAWLKEAPVAEQASALLDARKWRLLAHSREQGHFEEWQLDSHEQRILAEMPSRDFLIAIKELQCGMPREQVFAPGGPCGPPPLPGEPKGGWRRGGDRRWGGGADGEREGFRPRSGQGPPSDRRPGGGGDRR